MAARRPPQEVHAPWEYASQLQGGGGTVLTMQELLVSRGDAVLKTLQTSGVSKVGGTWHPPPHAHTPYHGTLVGRSRPSPPAAGALGFQAGAVGGGGGFGLGRRLPMHDPCTL